MLNELSEARRTEIVSELKEIESKLVVERPHVNERLVRLGERRSALLSGLYEAPPGDPLHTLLTECVRGKQPQDRVFTRANGKPVKDYRWAWWKLCVQVGLGHWECKKCGQAIKRRKCCETGSLGDRKYIGLFSHDMRRSAARSYHRAGVPESVVMKIGGWKTRTTLERYNIVNDKDVAEAVVMR